MGYDVVGHHPLVPGASKTAQAFAAACCLEDSLRVPHDDNPFVLMQDTDAGDGARFYFQKSGRCDVGNENDDHRESSSTFRQPFIDAANQNRSILEFRADPKWGADLERRKHRPETAHARGI